MEATRSRILQHIVALIDVPAHYIIFVLCCNGLSCHSDADELCIFSSQMSLRIRNLCGKEVRKDGLRSNEDVMRGCTLSWFVTVWMQHDLRSFVALAICRIIGGGSSLQELAEAVTSNVEIWRGTQLLVHDFCRQIKLA